MAYVTQYTANFTNELKQLVEVTIDKKNGSVIPVKNYPVISLRIKDNSDEQDIFSCIISKELELVLLADNNGTITWETFITNSFNDFKITVKVQNKILFIGFIAHEECYAPLQDLPYEIYIKATDGLGLLKGVDFKNKSGEYNKNFKTLIEYLSDALFYTTLNLNIKILCNIFHKNQLSKINSFQNDFFNQTIISANTFNNSIDEVDSCYDVIKKILNGWCSINQHDGQWQIVTLSERQYIFSDRYYVTYNYNANIIDSGILNEKMGFVGKNELIYPINETQKISSKYANKQVKTIYNYTYTDFLIPNQSLVVLGNEIPSLAGYNFDLFGNKVYYKANEIVNWNKSKGEFNNTTPYTGSKIMYTRTYYNEFGKKISTNFFSELDDLSGELDNHFTNSNYDFFVDANDKFSVAITANTARGASAGVQNLPNSKIVQIGLLKSSATSNIINDPTNSTNWYTLNAQGKWISGLTSYVTYGMTNIISVDYLNFVTYQIPQSIIPESGQIFIKIICKGIWEIQPIQIDYTPQTKSGYTFIKGEYHTNLTNEDLQDKLDKEIYISEGVSRTSKGVFIDVKNSNYPEIQRSYKLLTPNFYRFPNNTETKSFKQLVNYGLFNCSYRRFYKISGDFTSFIFNNKNQNQGEYLIGFHIPFMFSDMSPNRYFVLIPSVEIDLVSGNIKATFVEIYKDSNDGTQTGVVDKMDYIF